MIEAPSTSRAGRFVAIAAIVILLAVVVIAIGVVIIAGVAVKPTGPPGLVTASTQVTATRGTVVFSDSFHDPSSGWATQTLPSGTTFAYGTIGYVIVAKGTLDHFASAPYQKPVQQIAIAVTATQSTDAPLGAGYGVSCWRGANTSELRYDFLVTTGGDWRVDRRDGGLRVKPILRQGKSSAALGSAPIAVQGICATLADMHTTRLILFAGRQKLADFTDTATSMPDVGWLPDLIVTSDARRASTVTATRFEVRDLAA
jgi:hypothetical protein